MKTVLGTAGILVVLAALFPLSALAEVKTFEAEGSYTLGENDSRAEARRIAVLEAKRKALEAATAYVENLSEVKNMPLSRDEVKAYTAGLVEAEVVSEETRGTSQRPEVHARARARIDTGLLAEQIRRLRESEEAREQLQAALKEGEELKRDRERLLSDLSREKDKVRIDDIRKKLDSVLSREEANEEMKKVWKTLAKAGLAGFEKELSRVSPKELDEAAEVLERIVRNDPDAARAHRLLAHIYFMTGDKLRAERELRESIRIDPDNPLSHIRLGQMLRNSGRFAEAVRELRIAQRLRPGEPRILFHLGITHKAAHDCLGTVDYLDRFLRETKGDDTVPREMRTEAVHAVEDCRAGRRPPRRSW
ncbi:MAG: tetratricopeptide repeat protein [Alphaproteobacteria bacterium]|uniref:Tetratricopeptide repeat protein n=1 Tax=Candidatus Nitrobium versatile TaxID=2884831 RepID=A0A953M2K5_9BACT|nr:tetratricopeptide repeat protein [Candidatus Nitrobium versatile]